MPEPRDLLVFKGESILCLMLKDKYSGEKLEQMIQERMRAWQVTRDNIIAMHERTSTIKIRPGQNFLSRLKKINEE